MKKPSHEPKRDAEMRQRNVVFPDTVLNEARGWRSLMTQKEPLSILQVIGVLVFGLAVLGVLYMVGEEALRQFRETPGTGFVRVVAGFGGSFVLLVLLGAGFLLLRWRVQKALASARKQPPFSK